MNKSKIKNYIKIALILILSVILLKIKFAYAQNFMSHQKIKEMFYSVQIMFAVKGPKPKIWDGRASINEGKLVGIRSIGFDSDNGDLVNNDESRWICSIQKAKGLGREISEEGRSDTAYETVKEILGKGIILDFEAPETATVTLETAAGVLSFSLEDLILGKTLSRFNGNLEISLAPRMINISNSKDKEDYSPSLAIDSQGNIWTAWISYKNGKEEILYRFFNGNSWSESKSLISKNTHFFKPELAADSNGRVWIVWGQLDDDNWNLYAKMWDGNNWKSSKSITKENSPNSDHHIEIDKSDRLWIVWQCHVNGRLDISMKYYDPLKKSWSDKITVTKSYENDRQPSIAVDRSGNVYIAWECYREARHQILLKKYANGKFDKEILLRSSKWRVSHTDVMVDNQDKVWIAWDEAGSTWGYGKVGNLEGFYPNKIFKLLCYDRGSIYQTITQPYENFPAPLKNYADLPKLVCDNIGRIWVMFFHYTNKNPIEIWRLYGAFYQEDKWSDPIFFPQDTDRNIKAVEADVDPDGHLWSIWSSDSRKINSKLQENWEIYCANICLMGDSPKGVSLKPASLELDIATKEEIKKEIAKRREERYITKAGDKEYELIWGYYFKQHDLRGKLGINDFIYDVYCYTRDDQDLDFFAIEDYAFRSEKWYKKENFFYWMSEKILSLLDCPDKFFTFYKKGKSPYILPPDHEIIRKVAPPGVHVMTGIYVEGGINKQNILEAIKLRHFYEATDKIVIDLNTNGQIMGSQFYSDDPIAKVSVKIFGTDKITKANILLNKKSVYSGSPNKKDFEFTYADFKFPEEAAIDPDEGMHYLVDITQEDGAMGWTMPTCTHYRPDGIDY